jgi:hypothetical protein
MSRKSKVPPKAVVIMGKTDNGAYYVQWASRPSSDFVFVDGDLAEKGLPHWHPEAVHSPEREPSKTPEVTPAVAPSLPVSEATSWETGNYDFGEGPDFDGSFEDFNSWSTTSNVDEQNWF